LLHQIRLLFLGREGRNTGKIDVWAEAKIVVFAKRTAGQRTGAMIEAGGAEHGGAGNHFATTKLNGSLD